MKGAAAVLALWLCGCATARPLVEAEGWAEVDAAGPASARARALADAQRRAVESAGGLDLRAQTQVSQGTTLEQSLSVRSEGRIERYEVMSESLKGGTARVRLRAVVGEAPRTVAVLLEGEAGDGARQALSELGFTVVAEAEAAQWVVQGRSVVRPLPLRVGALRPYRAQVRLSARGLTSTREASALEALPPLAQSKALERAGFLSGRALGRDILALGLRKSS